MAVAESESARRPSRRPSASRRRFRGGRSRSDRAGRRRRRARIRHREAPAARWPSAAEVAVGVFGRRLAPRTRGRSARDDRAGTSARPRGSPRASPRHVAASSRSSSSASLRFRKSMNSHSQATWSDARVGGATAASGRTRGNSRRCRRAAAADGTGCRRRTRSRTRRPARASCGRRGARRLAAPARRRPERRREAATLRGRSS